MSKVIAEQVAKLPRWAQDHIKDLEMERAAAIRAMRRFEDGQTPSRISYTSNECTGEEVGPSETKFYIQSRRIDFKVGKSSVSVGYNNHGELQVWTDRGVVFIPESHNVLGVYPEDRIIYHKEKD